MDSIAEKIKRVKEQIAAWRGRAEMARQQRNEDLALIADQKCESYKDELARLQEHEEKD